ncbi:MAG: sulfate adenylyltransferase [Acidiferrobacterales bacterium]|nr:sulfate adenylyltransferase [Acidiferrobacterales bacterium]
MIRPYQSNVLTSQFVFDAERRAQLCQQADQLPSITLNSSSASSAVMLGAGYFSPLDGFMSRADALCIADEMRTESGLFWPVPILNRIHDDVDFTGDRVSLRDSEIDGNPPLAIQTVESVDTLSDDELMHIARCVFGTTDREHPGVNTFLTQGNTVVSGPIEVLNFSYFESEFPNTFRTASQIRTEIENRCWNKVVAFQTRNPMHRAHEELCKIALERTSSDGVVIHMLLGKLKPGDIPAKVRDDAIRKMVELYFPQNTVIITGYGFDMLYAGPREAVLHAIFRQNLGASHMIVGRDHAGVGDYYGAFDAQAIFHTDVPEDALDIEIFEADHTAWSKKLNEVVMMRDVPDHQKSDFILLSGTRVREMLSAGENLPEEFSRPEVAKILMDFYRHG